MFHENKTSLSNLGELLVADTWERILEESLLFVFVSFICQSIPKLLNYAQQNIHPHHASHYVIDIPPLPLHSLFPHSCLFQPEKS